MGVGNCLSSGRKDATNYRLQLGVSPERPLTRGKERKQRSGKVEVRHKRNFVGTEGFDHLLTRDVPKKKNGSFCKTRFGSFSTSLHEHSAAEVWPS